MPFPRTAGQSTQTNNGRPPRVASWILIQALSPFAFAAFLVVAVWGNYRPDLSSGADMYNHLMVCVTVTLIYIALQGFSVVLQPVGSDVRPFIDVLTSLIPLLVIAFALERTFSGLLDLDFYQKGVLWMGTIATIIDLSCFTLFAMKINRLAPDVVLTS